MIALVDYGAGNLTSVKKGLAAVGADIDIPRQPEDLSQARGIVVPGVGHFSATAALNDHWRHALIDALGRGTPFLGICLGMQWLFEGSDEAPDLAGLGYLPGRIHRLPSRDSSSQRIKVPHVGWNTIRTSGLRRSGSLPRAFEAMDGTFAYFTHTFVAPVTEDIAGVTEYGISFASAVASGHVWGVQFHPEKSSTTGLALLRAFAERVRER